MYIPEITGAEADLLTKMKRVEVNRVWEAPSFDVERGFTLSEQLMRHSIESGDYRFLNAALKLNDRIRDEAGDDPRLSQLNAFENEVLNHVRTEVGLV